MKKEMIVLLLLGMLLVSPLVLAQEQSQTYSGFNRFTDNVKMFFTSGNNKVMLALDIREKEVDSAMINIQNRENEKAEKNLKRAWKRLQFIQEEVSFDTAKEVKENSEEVRKNIMNEENLLDNFKIYALEEEKTGLTAELVIELEGKEGQTLEREVEVVISENGEQNRVIEIEGRMGEIDVEIKEWVVDSFDKTVDGDDGLTRVVANKIVKEDGDDGLTREIKTYVAGDGTDKNVMDDDVAPGPQGIVGNQGDGGMAPGTSTDTGTNVGDASGRDDASPDDEYDDVTGEPITNQIDSPANDIPDPVPDDSGGSDNGDSGGSSSDSGGESAPITGEVVRHSNSNNLLNKIFGWLF